MKKVFLSFIVLLMISFASTNDFTHAAERLSGQDRYSTAVEISKSGWDSADTVVIATGSSFPDALAGAPLAYLLDAPILLTKKTELTEVTKNEISRLGAKKE